MTNLELKAEKRKIFGKKLKALRSKGLVPAVVYGGSEGSIPLILELGALKRIFKHSGETTLIKLFIDNSDSKNVLIHDSARDPITDEIQHVDFYEVKMDEKIIAKIPLVFIGSSSAISDLGGILVKVIQELEIRALPVDLPHEIEVDISVLNNFEDTILVKDIKLPENIESLENDSAAVASIAPPRSDQEIEALSGEIEEKVENVKVETEEKTAERIKENEVEVSE